MLCRKGFKTVNISNGLFFFERCSLIPATVFEYKLNNARYEGLSHLKYNPLLIFTFCENFPTLHFIFLKNNY